MEPLLIAGLGNPGNEYDCTRHNAGTDFIDLLCEKYSVTLKKQKKIFAHSAEVVFDGYKLILLKPSLYMNESGLSIAKAKQFYNLNCSQMLIIHDELDLPNATIRLKESGGHGGHNGIRSIIDHLNGDNSFKRLRVGIGHPGKGKDIIAYVLKKAPSEQRKELLNTMNDFLEIGEKVMIDGWQKTVTYYHSGNKEEIDES